MYSGLPGSQVNDSTLRFFANHSLAGIITTLPLVFFTGLPLASSSGCGGNRSSTLAFGHMVLHGR
jgi:hypothetical protein